MFKKLILLMALVAIIPLDREKQSDLFEVAKATVSDLRGFCDRNPKVCLKSQAAIETFTSKAEAGAKLVVDIVNEHPDKREPVARTATLQTPGLRLQTGALPKPIESSERLPAYQDQYNEHYAAKASRDGTYNSDTLLPADRAPKLLP